MPHRPKPIYLLLTLLGIGVLFAACGRESVASRPLPPLGPTLSMPAEAARLPVGGDAGSLEVLFVDESIPWDWSIACEGELATFVQENGLPLERLLVTLTDHDDLPLGVAYPSADEPEALAFVGCESLENALACRVAVGHGPAGPALDVAVASALAYGVQEFYRSKSEANWNAQNEWEWAAFVPLVEAQKDSWRSVCLETLEREALEH